MANAEITALRTALGQIPPGLPLPQLRAAYDAIGGQFPLPADVQRTSTDAGGAPGEWTATPEADPSKAILYLHGGGYVIGSLASHRHLAAELGRLAGARTLAIDYRLAPEAPFPAAVDDALAAYRHILSLGISPSSIAIAGDSAGGGLTVATLMAAREAGLPQPACGLCISPWVDLEAVGASMTTKSAEDPMVQKEALVAWAQAYLDGASPKTPLAAPLHGDFRGLAPLLIQVGSAETLLDDAVRLAGAAGAAEVPVQLEIWPEMIHVWHFFFPALAEGRTAIAGAGSFIASRLR